MLRLRRGESGLLLGARFLLELLAPFVIGHAVDDLARFGIAERDALLLGRGAVPFRQAVAAEAGEVHQIDVLHIGAFAQMRDQRAERRRFELGAGLVFPLPTSSCVLYVAPPAALGRDLLEGPRQNEVSELLTGRKQTMRGFLDAIERAAEDSRVRGLYAHIDGDSLGLAKVQELRDAVQAFRARGKFAIAFSESFGEFGGGTRPYYLATAFDEIWLQPLGAVGLIGLHAEVPFLRGMLDKLGIEPSFARREQYKSAVNFLTETGMTAPQREEVESLLTTMADQIARGVAETRHLSESA